jgi:uncharacterized protein
VKASAAALLVLLGSAGCSAEPAETGSPDEPVRVQTALPARPDGPVLDQANILPAATEAALDARLRGLWSETKDVIVVVSVDSLGDQTIEDYGTALFKDWGIGDAETDRGLLVLIAPNERRVRIAVGCGLESTVTDERASEIIEQRFLPSFRDGNFAGGVETGVEALIARLALPRPANDPGPHSEICIAQARNAA